MIHHGCTHATDDRWYNRMADDDRKETHALMGYDGRYRCAECKRRVEMDVDAEAYYQDLEMLPNVETPYPEGWCK